MGMTPVITFQFLILYINIMKIDINDHRKIFAVQEEFSKLFHNLKIEFFAKPNSADGASSKELVKQASKTLGECRTIHTKGFLTLDAAMTISDLKQSLQDNFGLSISVFRKEDGKWVETSKEGNYSLEDQNTLAFR